MADISDTLAALSEAATQGEWELQEPMDHELWIVEAGKQAYEWRVIAGMPWPEQRGDLSRKQVAANAAFIVALVNAYRTGQLVPVPSVERVAAIIREHHSTIVRQPSRTNEPRRTFHAGDIEAATAVIAAMKDGRE